ncbi:probable disease resistance rpp8-like protein 4 [Phtheirospermum japonicum]|uniref:Probable disease resistance rpp8-like protein 4 n=1 Tax=Phtheirospermum japonicum TaxID=374723 RepID=A0A830BF47_9LAMI|nr:probable disease resistance rpp8-like protein 4 [Phtheirospermum japonicum]
MFKEASSTHHLDPKIHVIEAKISALESDLRVRSIKPRPNPVSRRARNQRRTYPHQVEEDFVGSERDIEDLVGKLVKSDGDRIYQVVSITGMGGIGKTTMAKKIYHHADIRSHFNAFAWVCVSQQWQKEDVLQRILNKLEPAKKKEISSMKEDELVEELVEVQERKRCLIVLDDVWETDVWDVLGPVFHTRRGCSRVLLTTRNKENARYVDMDAPCYLYEQRHLNEKESWELLKKKLYRGLNIEDQNNHMDMERLGKEMVGQCGGLPLAIIVLGGLLMTKSTISEWRTVHQNFNSYLRKGRNSREYGRVHEVLALSYHDLPYQLKPCFLYLGNFPEDSKIPTRKLYQLWAAEGFIAQESQHTDDEEHSIIDIAERYLAELVQRCMVEVRVEESSGRYKYCQLHDLTRELCLVKGKEENFLKKIPQRYEPEIIIDSPSSSAVATSLSVTRRLSIAIDDDFGRNFPPKMESLEHIRSALFFSRLSEKMNLQLALEFLCNESRLLRVLDLERFDFGEKLPRGIGNLVHLRYLSLRGSRFYKLPSSVGNLSYLQTLDLRIPLLMCLTIPNVLWKMKHLKHLYLPPTHKCTSKLDLSSLTKLEILKNFDIRVSDHRDIPKLTKLQKLKSILSLGTENLTAIINCLKVESSHIKNSSFRVRYDFRSERELTVLKQLTGFSHLHKLDLVGIINRLPEHFHFAQSLKKLTLRGSRLRDDPMATLEKLPNLYSLILRKNVFEGNEISCSPQGFPKLRILEVQGMSSLENWIVGEKAMPNLSHLTINECVNLRMVPEGIRFIGTLRELVIANMPEGFRRRVRKVQEGEEGGEDIYKVEHITTITITETSGSYIKKMESQLSGTSKSPLFQSIYPSVVPKQWQNS